MRSNVIQPSVYRTSDCQCKRSNSPGFSPSFLWHSGISGAADVAMLSDVDWQLFWCRSGSYFPFRCPPRSGFGKKHSSASYLVEIDKNTDLDPQALDADPSAKMMPIRPDPDPKHCKKLGQKFNKNDPPESMLHSTSAAEPKESTTRKSVAAMLTSPR